ncbi:MAG: hypothetical protein R3318_04845 [Gammaproteobacteria bacterium]|nr:hypothetical protein [Gammaproteobacteria bacterium]
MYSKNILPLILAGTLIACSGDDSGSGDHVWKDQVDTIERAKEAEKKVMEAVDLQRQAIEEQSQ